MRVPKDPRWTRETYRFSEAAQILQASPQTVANWFRGYKRRGKRYEPLFDGREDASRYRRGISFLELTEAKVVANCVAHGISRARIRKARAFAREWLDSDFPFATEQFKTDGSRLLYEFERDVADIPGGPLFADVGNAAGQTTLPGYITDAFDLLEFATPNSDTPNSEWPSRFYPRGPDAPLMIDPLVRSGQVIIRSRHNRGIPVDTIWRRFRGGDEPAFIAEDFTIDLAEVNAAIEFRAAA